MCDTISLTAPLLPKDRPRYLMGVGKPIDIVEAVARGIDMFDCVLPTRSGRHGQAWTWDGPVNLKNARFAEDDAPLDPASSCPASRDYSKAYLQPPVQGRRVSRADAALLAQHRLLPGDDGGDARGHRRGPLRVMAKRDARPLEHRGG